MFRFYDIVHSWITNNVMLKRAAKLVTNLVYNRIFVIDYDHIFFH